MPVSTQLLLPAAPIIVLDTETGGVSKQRNPLLSLGLLTTDSNGDVSDKREFKFAPPENTWLEVPVLEDQLLGKMSKQIDHWLNLTTGEHATPVEEKPTYFITAAAAEINHFVSASNSTPGWDLSAAYLWMEHGFSYTAGAEVIAKWLADRGPMNAVVAHAAQFDFDYVSIWMPELLSLLPTEWACTQMVYKHKFLDGKTKGSSVGAICKHAGWELPSELQLHSSLGDCLATHHIWRWLKSQETQP